MHVRSPVCRLQVVRMFVCVSVCRLQVPAPLVELFRILVLLVVTYPRVLVLLVLVYKVLRVAQRLCVSRSVCAFVRFCYCIGIAIMYGQKL